MVRRETPFGIPAMTFRRPLFLTDLATPPALLAAFLPTLRILFRALFPWLLRAFKAFLCLFLNLDPYRETLFFESWTALLFFADIAFRVFRTLLSILLRTLSRFFLNFFTALRDFLSYFLLKVDAPCLDLLTKPFAFDFKSKA